MAGPNKSTQEHLELSKSCYRAVGFARDRDACPGESAQLASIMTEKWCRNDPNPDVEGGAEIAMWFLDPGEPCGVRS